MPVRKASLPSLKRRTRRRSGSLCRTENPWREGQGCYYMDKDSEPSDGAADFAKWLKKMFKQEPVASSKEVEQIVSTAQATHKSAFDLWMKKYCAP